MALTREQIQAADDLPMKEVVIKEWGGSVFVKMMTASEKDRFEKQIENSKVPSVRAHLAVEVVCDEKGNQIFKPEDVEWLNKKSASALDKVLAASISLHVFTEKDVDNLEKKLEKTPS